MIDETLAKIEARIKNSEVISDAKRQELQNLVATLKSEIGALSRTQPEQAQRIAGYTEVSTREATRKEQNPDLLKNSLNGLNSSVKEFEDSHPQLVQVVNTISSTLSNLGI